MGRFIAAITAVKFDVIGIICRKSNVVAGVNGMPALILRAYHHAWCLFARQLGQGTAGHMALVPCHVGPAVAGATRTTERTSSGWMRWRWAKRPSWPWPMLRSDRLGG
jgi:hypothetical protein